jgi:glycosyltransferase involved in cell wall biosynthesis
MKPIVSIIIPFYNRENIISETLDSVLNQTFNDWECILIDDGSTDNTINVIKKYVGEDKRFSSYLRPRLRVKGPSSCRNIGLENAQGNFIIFLDSDDLLAHFCLEERVSTFNKNQNCDFLIFRMERFLEIPKKHEAKLLDLIEKTNELSLFLQLESVWQVTSPIYKKSFLCNSELKGFNENLSNFEDIEIAVKSLFLTNNYQCYKNIDSFYRNDANYKLKYNNIETKKKSVKAFIIFLNSINTFLESIPGLPKKEYYKKQLVFGYQKVFLINIKDNIGDFKIENKKIIKFLSNNSYFSIIEKIKFHFVHNILAKCHKVKGIGLYRLIKYIYKK